MITVYVTTMNPMYELRDENCITVNKRASTKWIEEQYLVENWQTQKDYFKKCFLGEHSTIETLHFRVIDSSCRGDVCNQIVRATKGLPRYQVRSSRPDWTGEPRKPSDETYVWFSSIWNPLAFINMCRQRLCMKAQKETREWVQNVLQIMKNSNDPMLVALAECCVPNCEYRGCRCFEMKPCGKYPICNGYEKA